MTLIIIARLANSKLLENKNRMGEGDISDSLHSMAPLSFKS